MKRVIANWSGSVGFAPAEVRYPASLEEISSLVREAAAGRRSVRVIGAGHSFTPLVTTEDVLVSLDRYAGIEDADAAALTATVRGGTRLHSLGPALWDRGLAQEALGDIDRQSIAGAVSTGTHGTGIGFGSISTQIASLTLVTASGEVLECSDTVHADVFNAARVSLGSLGILANIRLRLVPSFNLRLEQRCQTLGDCLRMLQHHVAGNRHFEFFYFPHTDVVQAKFCNATGLPEERSPVKYFINDRVLENGAFGAVSGLSRAIPGLTIPIARLLGRMVSDVEKVNRSYRIFCASRNVVFNEMEYAVPLEAAADAVAEIASRIKRERFRVHFPVECRFVKGDDICLSPAYGRDSAFIAVHMYRGMPREEFFAAMEEIFIRYGGRPHWGKMHTRKAADLGPLYPKWDEFHRARARLDPDGVFMNRYLEELFEPAPWPDGGSGPGIRSFGALAPDA